VCGCGPTRLLGSLSTEAEASISCTGKGAGGLRQDSLRGTGRVSPELTRGFEAAVTVVPQCGGSLRMAEVQDQAVRSKLMSPYDTFATIRNLPEKWECGLLQPYFHRRDKKFG